MKLSSILTKELLYREFVLNKKSIKTIAKDLNIKSANSITQYINKYKLSREPLHNSEQVLTKDILYNEYIINNKSIKTIVAEYGFKNKYIITRLLQKYNIPKRIRTNKSIKLISEYKRRRKGFKGISGRYWYDIKKQASTRNLEFNITIEYIWWIYKKQKQRCNLTGEKIYFNKTSEPYSTRTASLDRIDSSKGYIKGNLQWLHKDINFIKSDYNQNDFIKLCLKVSKYTGAT